MTGESGAPAGRPPVTRDHGSRLLSGQIRSNLGFCPVPRLRAAAAGSETDFLFIEGCPCYWHVPMPGIWETNMNFSQWSRSLVKTLAVVLALALPTALAISSA